MVTASVPSAFEHFTRLGPSSYISNFPPAPPNSPTDPDLILFPSWLNAPPRPAYKYALGLHALYPSARIIILSTTTQNNFLRTPWRLHAAALPVVKYIRGLDEDKRKILCVSFSNGGLLSLLNVAAHWRKLTDSPLPITAHIVDSAPGKPSFWSDIRAVSQGLPPNPVVQFLGKSVFTVVASLVTVAYRLFGIKHIVLRIRAKLNDTRLLPTGTRRTYIYSKEDDMVQWRAVEEHAADAQKLGWIVRTEEFEGSRHVAHMALEPERYWGTVKETWLRAVGAWADQVKIEGVEEDGDVKEAVVEVERLELLGRPNS
jgi:hypothetical protein